MYQTFLRHVTLAFKDPAAPLLDLTDSYKCIYIRIAPAAYKAIDARGALSCVALLHLDALMFGSLKHDKRPTSRLTPVDLDTSAASS